MAKGQAKGSDPASISTTPNSENVTHGHDNGSSPNVVEEDLDLSPVNRLRSIKIAVTLVLLTLISMLIAILVVCLIPRKSNSVCQRPLKATRNSSEKADALPRSLATGDFNNDHILDIVVANSGTGNIGIFFGFGNGTFTEQTTYFIGAESIPFSVVTAHLNHDYLLDIAVTDYGTNSIRILLGQPNGTFLNYITFSTYSSRPMAIVAGDFNGDKISDLAVVNYGTHTIAIYFGNGDGSFTNAKIYFMGYDSMPYSIVIDDFNQDQFLDLAIANSGTNNIALLFGYGNGSFGHLTIYSTDPRSQPRSIAAGDFNNDNLVDLVVANYGTNNIGIFFGRPNGTFDRQKTFPLNTNSFPEYVTVGDLNKDNQTDIIIVDPTSFKVHIYPGYGNGTFPNLTTYMTGNETFPRTAVVADFNQDNQSDLAVVNFRTNDLVILIEYSRISDVSQTQYSFRASSNPTSVVVSDFNNDQYLDIAVNKLAFDSIAVLLGYGNGNFRPEISYSLGQGSSPQCICTGDLNNDRSSDLVVADYGLHTISVLFGYGNGSFGNRISYPTGVEAFPIYVVVGHFNQDNALDIAVANFRIDNVVIFLNHGNGSFGAGVEYSTGARSDPNAMYAADFNNDYRVDIAVANAQSSNVVILFGNGDGTFQSIVSYSTGFMSHPDSIIVGDINKDKFLDIIIADSTSDYVAILLGKGNGTFHDVYSYTDETFSNPSGLVLGDVDYDNRIDIIVTNLGTHNVGVLGGLGNGSFRLIDSYTLSSGAGPKGVVIGDFDNNTRWDIVVAESGIGSINLLVRYFAASFRNGSAYSTSTASRPYTVTVGDFNYDNNTDILVPNFGSDNVGIFYGYGNGTMANEQKYFVGTNSHPVQATVMRHTDEKRIDIVTVNPFIDSISVLEGDNNGSFGGPSIYPTRLGSVSSWIAVGDLNGDQKQDLIVSNTGRDNIGIYYGYQYRSFQTQQTYFNQFTLRPSSIFAHDLNNDTFVDITATFAANDSIGLFFGYGNGSFAQPIFYPIEHYSYPYGIVHVDLNNDHLMDIVVANSGSHTIGVFLGYGNSTFASVMIFSTGNNTQPYAAAAGDFNNDQWMDIVVANYKGNSIGVFIGYGNGSFAPVVIYQMEDGSRPQSVAVGDFNNDNRLDIVVANYRRDNMILFINNGNGTFPNQVPFSTGYRSMPTFIIVDDFNNDSQVDVAVSNKNTDNIGVFYGQGNGTFSSVKLFSMGEGSSPCAIRSGDFNNDGLKDIAVVSSGTNALIIMYALEGERFLLGPSYTTGLKAGPISLAIGDFDGNDRLDVTTANYLGNNIGVHISYGMQVFGGMTTLSTGLRSSPYAVAVSDFNNDENSDIVVVNYGTNNIGILLGYGNGSFAPMETYPMGDNANPIAVVLADLNNDNQSDIVVANFASNTISILHGYGNGSFINNVNFSTGYFSLPTSLTIGDYNNDKILDIIIITTGNSQVTVYKGYGNGTYKGDASYTIGYKQNPYAVAVADFNNDGRLDIAVSKPGGDDVEILLQAC